MRTTWLGVAALLATGVGCAKTGYVRSDAALAKVVVYKNGVAYFERNADPRRGSLKLSVPERMVDDLMKSLRIVDASAGTPAPVADPTVGKADASGNVEVRVALRSSAGNLRSSAGNLRLSYLSEAPSWKPSYRVTVRDDGVDLAAWAIVDNTSGEDWHDVKLGVASSSALSFRYDLKSVRRIRREKLGAGDRFAQAPPLGSASRRERSPTAASSRGAATQPRAIEATEAKPQDPQESRRLRARVAELRAIVERSRDEASKSGDVVKKLCLADKLQQFDVLLPNIGARIEVLDRAIADKNVERRLHELTIMRVYGSRAEQLAAEAQQCIGQDVAPLGDSKTTVMIDPGLPPDDDPMARPGTSYSAPAPQAQDEVDTDAIESPTYDEPAPLIGRDAKDEPGEPRGSAYFEASGLLSVASGSSAMISVVDKRTTGEIVYLFDPDSERGSSRYAFRAVRLVNPTDSMLDSGPVTVFDGSGFIGEGLTEPIAARGTAFVPFALDRQVHVERKNGESDRIERIVSFRDGGFATVVRRTRTARYSVSNRSSQKTVLWLRHTLSKGYELSSAGPGATERIGDAYLYRIDLPAYDGAEVIVEETTPMARDVDVSTGTGARLLRDYLESPRADTTLASELRELLDQAKAIADLERTLSTRREQLRSYRGRSKEVRDELGHFENARSTPLRKTLEQRLGDLDAEISKLTSEIVGLHESLLATRTRFQDVVLRMTLMPPSMARTAESAANGAAGPAVN